MKPSMTLFAPDLYRSFTFGFIAGALMVGAATISNWGPHLESPALASEPISAPVPAAEFIITPLETQE